LAFRGLDEEKFNTTTLDSIGRFLREKEKERKRMRIM
jgi:hypothetical protein